MARRVSPKLAEWMLVIGIVLVSIAFTLSLFPLPSKIAGIPAYPFFSLPFPLLSGLVVTSAILLAAGWISHPRGSLRQVLFGAMAMFLVGVVIRVISFLTAVPVDFEGTTIFVELYAAHATMTLSVGIFLALFGILFWVAERREIRREKVV